MKDDIISLMQEIIDPISKQDLLKIGSAKFGNFVKAVIDIKSGTLVIDASLHADEEAYLLSKGSLQENLWGINLYPELDGEDFIEFDSMINLRPSQGNYTRGVDDLHIRAKIIEIVNKLIT